MIAGKRKNAKRCLLHNMISPKGGVSGWSLTIPVLPDVETVLPLQDTLSQGRGEGAQRDPCPLPALILRVHQDQLLSRESMCEWPLAQCLSAWRSCLIDRYLHPGQWHHPAQPWPELDWVNLDVKNSILISAVFSYKEHSALCSFRVGYGRTRVLLMCILHVVALAILYVIVWDPSKRTLK